MGPGLPNQGVDPASNRERVRCGTTAEKGREGNAHPMWQRNQEGTVTMDGPFLVFRVGDTGLEPATPAV